MIRTPLAFLAPLLFGACSGDDGDTAEEADTGAPAVAEACEYPEGAVEPMTLGEVISPYSWRKAIHRDGRRAVLDLATVPCTASGEIDWSPFDMLLFVSIPAW